MSGPKPDLGYRLTIYPSRLKYLLYLNALALLSLALLFQPNRLFLLTLSAVIIIFSCFIGFQYFVSRFAQYTANLGRNIVPIEMLLDESGQCQFLDQHGAVTKVWQLTAKSYCNGIVVYLTLELEQSVSVISLRQTDEKQRLAIYRDSVNSRDYARLCRIVNKIRQQDANQLRG
ncbi:hypothetical protein J7384_02965 [Endozoicomonas sp. G2_1]|uniref:protein YgfX n=1 Tax=Endozoicomonas sp. G2_1 TaxID=2821091 RepID=UPI001ADB6CE4|nr:protein YgfX [Endozoicomonas sp. G2_1]MBO9489314.1 hypothetical protein [Endozoicomonas sp. G2_1]